MSETENKIRVSRQRLNEYHEELERLKEEKNAIADRIRIAREFGDLSENAEYDTAKNEQAMNAAQIINTEHLIQIAIVDDAVTVMDVVCVESSDKDLFEVGEEITYTIVGEHEKMEDNKISRESAVGSALLGHETGDVVTVILPTATVKLSIVNTTSYS